MNRHGRNECSSFIAGDIRTIWKSARYPKIIQDMRQSEIQQLRHTLASKTDVTRLDVAVQDAGLMGPLQNSGEYNTQFNNVVDVEHAGLQLILKSATFQKLKHEH